MNRLAIKLFKFFRVKFSFKELKKCKHGRTYLLEKILEDRGDHVLGKYLGVEQPEIISKNDILDNL